MTKKVKPVRQFRTLPPPEKAHPLARQLFELMAEERVTILDLAEKAGVNRNTLTWWKGKSKPQLDLLEACLNSLGYELCIRKVDIERMPRRKGPHGAEPLLTSRCFDGEPMTIKQALALHGAPGVTTTIVSRRIHRLGYTFERAVTTPIKPNGRPRNEVPYARKPYVPKRALDQTAARSASTG